MSAVSPLHAPEGPGSPGEGGDRCRYYELSIVIGKADPGLVFAYAACPCFCDDTIVANIS